MTPADWRRLADIAEECTMEVGTELRLDSFGIPVLWVKQSVDLAKFAAALRKEAERVEAAATQERRCPECLLPGGQHDQECEQP